MATSLKNSPKFADGLKEGLLERPMTFVATLGFTLWLFGCEHPMPLSPKGEERVEHSSIQNGIPSLPTPESKDLRERDGYTLGEGDPNLDQLLRYSHYTPVFEQPEEAP